MSFRPTPKRPEMREEMGSPSPEVFHNRGDVALKDVGSGHSGVGQGLGLGISEVFSNLNDCIYGDAPLAALALPSGTGQHQRSSSTRP